MAMIYESKDVNKWSGTDQAIISNCFGEKSNHISKDDGIVSLRDHPEICANAELPSWVRIVSFYHNSKYGDMSDSGLQKKHPWLVKHWLDYADDTDLSILDSFKVARALQSKRKTRKQRGSVRSNAIRQRMRQRYRGA
jgi:hypothetical protein